MSNEIKNPDCEPGCAFEHLCIGVDCRITFPHNCTDKINPKFIHKLHKEALDEWYKALDKYALSDDHITLSDTVQWILYKLEEKSYNAGYEDARQDRKG